MNQYLPLVILVISVFLLSCGSKSNSYEEAMQACMENVIIEKFTLENGKTGHSYSGFNMACLVGAKLPDFMTTSLDGHKINHMYLDGKINVINFWFIACRPCVSEIPDLNKLVSKFGTDQINYIAISRDADEVIRQFLGKREFNFEHITNAKDLISEVFSFKGGYPTTIITNKNMEIISVFTGSSSIGSDKEGIDDKIGHVIRANIDEI